MNRFKIYMFMMIVIVSSANAQTDVVAPTTDNSASQNISVTPEASTRAVSEGEPMIGAATSEAIAVIDDSVAPPNAQTPYQSTMFDEEELPEVNKVIDALNNGEPLPADKSNTTPTPAATPEEKTYTYPQFYLTSIVYYRPNDWVIWLNDQKITPDNKDVIERLSIQEVTASQILFNYVLAVEDRSDFNLKPESERVVLDPYTRSAQFMLQPNQTFSSYNWKVYEGAVQPVEIAAKAKPSSKIDKALTDVKEVFQPIGAKNSDEKQDTGIQGLMHQYDKLDKPTP